MKNLVLPFIHTHGAFLQGLVRPREVVYEVQTLGKYGLETSLGVTEFKFLNKEGEGDSAYRVKGIITTKQKSGNEPDFFIVILNKAEISPIKYRFSDRILRVLLNVMV